MPRETHGSDDRLDRLSAVEVELLRLLGEGHTAKSIAGLKGITAAAVNERFRSARRKTGLGSSREIARLILARENRDDLIGLEPAIAPDPTSHRVGAPRRRPSIDRWRYPMIIAGLAAVAVFAGQSVRPETTSRLPPLFNLRIHTESNETPSTTAARNQMMTEALDPAWAAGAEASLRETYTSLAQFDHVFAQVSITCASTLCEFHATTPVDVDLEAFGDVLQQLQQTRPPQGLSRAASMFRTSDGPSFPLTYAAYFRRDE